MDIIWKKRGQIFLSSSALLVCLMIEFLKSLGKNIDTCKDIYYDENSLDTLILESKLVASCLYEENTQWGKQEGFLYLSVLEDYFTGLTLHCKGWKSVFLILRNLHSWALLRQI